MAHKKILAIFLTMCMIVSMAACGNKTEAPAQEETEETGESTEEPAADAAKTEDPYADFEPVTLRLGHSHSESEVPHEEMVNMAESIYEKTNGKVTVEIYPNNSIGSNEDVLEQMRAGTNLAIYADPGRLDTYVPGVSAISAPYVIEGYEDIAKLKDCPTVQNWEKQLEDDFGLTVLSWNFCQGFRNVFATKGGTTPDDFRDVTLRSASAPIWVATVNALGATPVSLEFGEMYSGIQTKIVDGCEQNYGAVYNNAIYEVITTETETRHVYLANCILISSTWLRQLPEEFQQIIIEETEAAGERTSQRLAEQDDFYREEMEKAGMEVIPYEELDIEAFKAKAEAAYDELGITEAVNSLKADLGK